MRAVPTRLMTMPEVLSYRLPTIILPGKSMVLTEASIHSTSDQMAVRLRSRAVASAGCPPNGAPRNGLPAPKAVGPFAICLISDRMRMDDPRGLPQFPCLRNAARHIEHGGARRPDWRPAEASSRPLYVL